MAGDHHLPPVSSDEGAARGEPAQASSFTNIGLRHIYNSDHDALRQSARRFFTEQVAPNHAAFVYRAPVPLSINRFVAIFSYSFACNQSVRLSVLACVPVMSFPSHHRVTRVGGRMWALSHARSGRLLASKASLVSPPLRFRHVCDERRLL